MNSLILSIIAVLSVIFIIISLECILRAKTSYICTKTDENDECIEAKLRLIMAKNPNSEIIVINCGRKNSAVLEKLSDDFPEIHIL